MRCLCWNNDQTKEIENRGKVGYRARETADLVRRRPLWRLVFIRACLRWTFTSASPAVYLLVPAEVGDDRESTAATFDFTAKC
jgi:hypothetical protein